MQQIFKYPRTHHIEGSLAGPGDETLKWASFEVLKDRFVVIEEKLDGANSGISFSPEGKLQLQSRGHYLTGGPREKHFALFKTWANRYAANLWAILGDRYVLYGEWLYAKHTVFYTDLPHYFMEFDLLDTQSGTFLDTVSRKERLADAPFIRSVPILYEGTLPHLETLLQYVGPSHYIAEDAQSRLTHLAEAQELRVEQVLRETDDSRLMEGLYIKVEQDGEVLERYKYVRSGFMQTVFESGGHWLDRPIIPNQLAEGVNLFA
ncbi:MAG: RNA ligase family protein [Bacteroidota bacterium]